MNETHLNLGLSFAKPYESHYAILRRFLVANLGIPLTTLEKILREKIPYHSGLSERILALHPSTYIKQGDNSYDGGYIYRQCPQCAVNMYHTDIYSLPWLKRCPVHHCRFISNCPVCKQPWPDKLELAIRECPGCGRSRHHSLSHSMTEKEPNDRFQVIADIYNFIQYKDDNNVHLYMPQSSNSIDWIGNWKWWCDISISDPLFPGCQLHRHPEFTYKKLKSLHIETLPVLHKTSELVLVKFGQLGSKHTLRRDQCCLSLNNASQSALHSDFLIMKRILRWIRKKTNKNHQLHISSYRHLSSKELFRASPPCQFCTALSLWFFYVASRKYGKHYIIDTADYPFCEQSGYSQFYDVSESNTVSHQWKSHYKIGRIFSNWHYRRGLEISFIDIFHFVEYLLQHDDYSEIYRYRTRNFNDQSCLVDIIHNKLHYYYEHAQPLDKLKISKPPNDDSHCKNHRQYLNSGTTTIVPFDIDIRTHDFTYSDFLNLHDKFRSFIDCRR